ncbi:MAG: Mth938-like domain-containing protein [Boseongicola sp.]|nr:Mth938-like domain-containing protein [Boseongicola sp.]MDD9977738.1 Mth938-like domain-containing protein [Boseongicola sp.]
MRLNEVTYNDALPVDGYGEGFFRIGGEAREAPLAILPTGVAAWGGYDDVQTLVSASEVIDFCLIGTGKDIAHIPAQFREALENAGIGVEIMSSPQACRTYNVLLGEGRRLGLAVMPV